MADPREALARLCAAAEDGRLVMLCRRHNIRLLGAFGSATDPDWPQPEDLDLAVEFEPGAEGDVIALVNDLMTLARFDRVDVLDLGRARANPVARTSALVGGVPSMSPNPARTLAPRPTRSCSAWTRHGCGAWSWSCSRHDSPPVRSRCRAVTAAPHAEAAGRPRESFLLPVEAGALSKEAAECVRPSAGARNVLVHEYLTIDYAQVAAAASRAPRDYGRYIRAIADFLLRREGA